MLHVGEGKKMIKILNIVCRRDKIHELIGHKLCHPGLLTALMTGKIVGKIVRLRRVEHIE